MYYYTLASLPMQLYGQYSISVDDVKTICRSTLKDEDYHILCQYQLDVSNECPGHSAMGKAYYYWERALRNALVSLRASDLKKDKNTYAQSVADCLDAEAIANEAFKKDNPLEAENLLNKERWSYIESLMLNHYFDFDHLVLYFLQTQLNERISQFKEELGFSKYKEIYQHILDDFDQSLESGEIE